MPEHLENVWYTEVKKPDKPLSEWSEYEIDELAMAEVCRHLVNLGFTIDAQDYECDDQVISVVAHNDDDMVVLCDVYSTSTGKEGVPFLEIFSDDVVRMRKRMALYLEHHISCSHIRYDFFAVNFVTPEKVALRHLMRAAEFKSAVV